MTTILDILTEQQRLELAARIEELIDATEQSFLRDVHVRAEQVQPLLALLEKEGFIHRDLVRQRVFPGPRVRKPPEVEAFEQRRDKMLRASPIGRAVLGLDTPTPKPKAGSMSPERRKQLLAASEGGRGMLREEAAKKA